MKSTIEVTAAAFAVCACAVAHAQASQPITRAQVRSEVVRLVREGYEPNRDDYPETLLSAQRQLARQRDSSPGQDPRGNLKTR
ncbi:DUF4148 domain-containing protein [Caballeronia sp. LP006]|uniref:DUF4148 domain-containing protein n=1 Tax=Caballeronia sp. LP006 TaxID=3038552 RepID=UPI0038D484D2